MIEEFINHHEDDIIELEARIKAYLAEIDDGKQLREKLEELANAWEQESIYGVISKLSAAEVLRKILSRVD